MTLQDSPRPVHHEIIADTLIVNWFTSLQTDGQDSIAYCLLNNKYCILRLKLHLYCVVTQHFMDLEVYIQVKPITRVRTDDYPTTRIHPIGHKRKFNLLKLRNIKVLTRLNHSFEFGSSPIWVVLRGIGYHNWGCKIWGSHSGIFRDEYGLHSGISYKMATFMTEVLCAITGYL